MVDVKRVGRACAAAALIASAITIAAVPGVGAQPEPTATLEVGSPGTVNWDYTNDGTPATGGLVLLLEAPAVCPDPLNPDTVGTEGYFVFGEDQEDVSLVIESGTTVLLVFDFSEVPLPDGLYQFCAYDGRFEDGIVGDLLAELEAEISAPEPEPTTTTVAPSTTTTSTTAAPVAPVTPRYTG